MRIGILSDTHNQVARTARAIALLIAQRAEVLCHCGDLTGPEVIAECSQLPCYYVFGNNDFEQDRLRRAIDHGRGTCLERGGVLVFQGRRVAMAHGDSPSEVRRLSALKPDFLLFGHSHRPADERDGSVRRVNPGALHRAAAYTVAVLDLADDTVQWLKVDERRLHKP
jgi:putative phosphoesterase